MASNCDVAETAHPLEPTDNFESAEFEVWTRVGEDARPEDLDSVATAESQWLFVDAEEELTGQHLEDAQIQMMPSPEKQLEVVEAPAAAELLAVMPLQPGSPMITECQGFRGDVTEQWCAAFEGFTGLTGAVCLGRAIVLPAFATAGLGTRPSHLPLDVHVQVLNSGPAAWPDAACLRCVAGDPHGFDLMHIGALLPGQGADLQLDLHISADGGCPGTQLGARSAWVLTDDVGRPFGPLLVLEVMWL